MGTAYQINDQHKAYFLTFQVVGWADVFSRQIYRDIILASMTYPTLGVDCIYALIIIKPLQAAW